MTLLTKEEAKQLLEKAMGMSKADECSINLHGSKMGNIRYARNTVSTSGTEENISMSITSAFGKKTGTVNLNEFSTEALERGIRRSEELAGLSPENPESMPLLGPQEYGKPAPEAFVQETAGISPEFRTKVAESSIVPAKDNKAVAAGFMENYAGFSAMMTSKGLFAYNKSTNVDFNITVRSDDATGSGYAIRDFNDVSKLDVGQATQVALDKALQSRNAKAIEPGKYTVILEPAAAVGLLQNMMYSFDARSADEGRSFLSKKGGGTKLGEQIVDERINVYSDYAHPEVPGSPWSYTGQPRKRIDWLSNGSVKNLYYSRYWAEQKGVEAMAFPSNIIFEGGDQSLDDLVKSTKKGVLVTRTWYIRPVDPQTLLYTGLTRDGTFYVENGKIMYPIKNFRFNESPVIMLNNLEALGKSVRIEGNMIPSLKIRDFNFTSLSDAI